LSDPELESRVGENPKKFDFDRDQVQNGSGNKLFDRALAHTLAKTSDQFNVLPGFAFFDDKTSRNAFASRSSRLGRADGSVVFGKNMFSELMQRPQHPELGIAAVCAHEFGHIAQYKHGIEERLVGQDHRVKRLELHADFLAGYFAGRRKLETSDFPAAVFAETQFNLGDKNFGDPDHHGSNKERGDAVVAGFEAAYRDRLDFMPALEKGVQYVMEIPMDAEP
jgi:predicted metalloprotease